MSSLHQSFFKSRMFLRPEPWPQARDADLADYLMHRILPKKGDTFFDIVNGKFTALVALSISLAAQTINIVRSVKLPLTGTYGYAQLCDKSLQRMVLRGITEDLDQIFEQGEAIAVRNATADTRIPLHFPLEKTFLTAIASAAQVARDKTLGEAGLIRLVSYTINYLDEDDRDDGYKLTCYTEDDLIHLLCPDYTSEQILSMRMINPTPKEESKETLARILKQAGGDPELFCTLLQARPHLRMYLADVLDDI